MARYDAGWGRWGGGSGDYGQAQPQRGYGSEPGYGGRRYEGDSDFDPEALGYSETTYSPSAYGPGRYGLGPYHARLRKRRRPDGELKEEVEEALFYDTWVDAEAITVEVSDGVVTLRGELPSYEEIRYATDDAWDVDGVVGVRSDLSVQSG
jgi:hypothetical protein